ncbi:anti-sigma factor [Pseudomonas entomophila]|uniref:anti-sigma factor n=1 Tax=Pseudomonas entomophila TaxID=312306 RepID=UPI0023D84755|nr:anti-sigma factor [Pseudomonas entomophila]MDF0732742.1 anti-sigma factor [Pseudomonas entomophila]
MSIEQADEQPGSLDELAGEYVLGTLSARHRAEVERRLPHDAALRAAVEAWERRLFELTELAPPQAPSPQLWQRIQRSTGSAQPLAQPRPGLWHRLALWRGLAAAGVTAALALAVALLFAPQPQTAYLVVLVAPSDQAPGWVVQASDPRQIQLIPLGDTPVPSDKALEFWTKGDDWQGPVSLGLVKPGQTVSVPLDKLPPLAPNQLFELTLESPTGSPTGKPTGPVQFIGRAVKVI